MSEVEKHEKFLTKTFPKILEEEVTRRMKILLEEKEVSLHHTNREDEVPFVVEQLYNKKEKNLKTIQRICFKWGTKQYKTIYIFPRVGWTESVLDSFKEPVNENIDKTVTFTLQGAGAGLEGMRDYMAQQMGYGNMAGVGVKKTGLGVKTGLAGLDRILNRDNSELVKKFKR